MKNAEHLIWVDMEMTGLDPATDRILEIATVITDKNLNILAHGPVLAIWQPRSVLENMDEWNTKYHTQSGLKKRVLEAGISEIEAEQKILAFLRKWVPSGRSPMCGNTISQDRRFMVRYMPELEQYFHYRHIDVSTVKELAKRWAPYVATSFKKTGKHQALDDILESIAEMRHYREQFFKVIPATEETIESR